MDVLFCVRPVVEQQQCACPCRQPDVRRSGHRCWLAVLRNPRLNGPEAERDPPKREGEGKRDRERERDRQRHTEREPSFKMPIAGCQTQRATSAEIEIGHDEEGDIVEILAVGEFISSTESPPPSDSLHPALCGGRQLCGLIATALQATLSSTLRPRNPRSSPILQL